MKVGFFIWALRAAGAERVLSTLANAWAEKGWEIVVFTLEAPEAEPFYPLHPSIQLRRLDLLGNSASTASALANNFTRIRLLRRRLAEARPDVLISFIDQGNVLALLASRGLGIPVIISERTDPSRRPIEPFWNGLRKLTYPLAEGVVFQSQGVADWFTPRIRARGTVIPNPVPAPPPGSGVSTREGPTLRLVSLGRLARIKGFDVLLAAFAQARAHLPLWRLEIWGEGPEREALEKMAQDLGLTGQVRFPGLTPVPSEVLRGADLFVLSSHAEGFPNALVEAMAMGLPVVSTRFGGAVDDIVQDGVNGLLVPPGDSAALAHALVRLMSDPLERSRLGEKAREVVQRFSTERIVALWETAIGRAMALKPHRGRAGGDTCPT